ncbi:MAG: capsule assembly Wzi family protein [Deltaproteobacteria bacterium]|nr:capsule assembly Wzi family protein [Deltaproteobacteria bacterium]
MTLFPAGAFAGASINIPAGSGIYGELERLEVKGLLKSSMLSTKPFTRIEGARLAGEAEFNWEVLPEGNKKGQAGEIIKRLKGEFGGESSSPAMFIKPIDGPYAKFLYSASSPHFTDINNNGDRFSEGMNLRAGFSLNAGFFDSVALNFTPEYRLDEGGSRGRLLYGYLNVDLSGLLIEAGRDSQWWGPGFHGDLLITNNARPFDMVKLTTARPVVLPWVFGRLGLFKPTAFLTRLEEDRDFPKANLFGMRLDFKPTPRFQFGLSRVFMFGGKGRGGLDAGDWLNVLIASDSAEHSASAIDGNQIASIDASYVYVNKNSYIPFSGVKLYTEWGAEDSSGDTKTPSGRANMYGAFIDEPFRLEDIDFRIEWANTARSARYGPQWYTHWKYTTGYTYEGNVIGHHMGSDARDLFLRAQWHGRSGALAGIEADRESSGVHSISGETKRDWLSADFSCPYKDVRISGGLGFEETDSPREGRNSNTAAWINLGWYF